MDPHPPSDIARNFLVIIILSVLMVGSLYILHPFIPGLIWATTIVVATWPVMLAVQRRLGNRRWLATVVMLAILLFIIVVPLYQTIATLASHSGDIMAAVHALPTYTLPPPPEWLGDIPFAGYRIVREWQTMADAGPGGLLAEVEPYVTIATRWLITHAASIGAFVTHMFVSIVISGILYMKGDQAAQFVTRFAIRLANERGAGAVKLVGASIRAIALGIIVTALAQSVLGGIGLWVAGVPAAGLLTALMLMLCVAQLGPLLPMLGGVVWLFRHDMQLAASLLLVWSILITMLDNLLRPLLIRRGVNLSMILILSGVIGGLFAFGIAGLFIGPVILAVTSTLLMAWIDDPVLKVPNAVPEGGQATTTKNVGD